MRPRPAASSTPRTPRAICAPRASRSWSPRDSRLVFRARVGHREAARAPRPPFLADAPVSRRALRFPVELKKQIPTTIRLYNPGASEMAFKVKTTAPKKYCVKPNTGFVQAGATQVVHVIMQAQREWPADINACKDKFLVQSCPSGGSTDFTELFAKGKEGIWESKLRVAYAQPAPPPSPVPEGEEGDGKESTDAPSASVSQMYSSKSTEVASKPMPSDVAGLRRELERYRIKNDGLTADLNAALRSNKNGGVARGFSLLHLLITGASRPTPKKSKKSKKTDPTFLSFDAYPSLPLVLVGGDQRAARRLGFFFYYPPRSLSSVPPPARLRARSPARSANRRHLSPSIAATAFLFFVFGLAYAKFAGNPL